MGLSFIPLLAMGAAHDESTQAQCHARERQLIRMEVLLGRTPPFVHLHVHAHVHLHVEKVEGLKCPVKRQH